MFILGEPPPNLMARLIAHREQFADGVWARMGRARVVDSWERLRADRQA